MSSKLALMRVIAGGVLAGMLASAPFWPLASAAPAPAKSTTSKATKGTATKGAATKGAAAKAAPPAIKIPDFAPDSKTGWLSAGTEFIAMPDGPKPVTFDKQYPYVPNGAGEQPTFRVADVDNPILLPWVKDALRRVNERAPNSIFKDPGYGFAIKIWVC